MRVASSCSLSVWKERAGQEAKKPGTTKPDSHSEPLTGYEVLVECPFGPGQSAPPRKSQSSIGCYNNNIRNSLEAGACPDEGRP